MAQNVLTLDEASFSKIIKSLQHCSQTIKDQYQNGNRAIGSCAEDWDDNDYKDLFSSLKLIELRLDDLCIDIDQMIAEAEHKIEMLEARKNIKL